jgi:Beta-propeller repeat/Abnormal spindle-like microcephaly-assoc'd, ASPM-SPD-2-Hydin/HYDIN/CFA65/VesB-like, Ig-like domain
VRVRNSGFLLLLASLSANLMPLQGQTFTGSPAADRDSVFSPSSKVSPRDAASANANLSVQYTRLPLEFEANQGQSDSQVKFLARGQGYALFLTSNDAVLSLSKSSSATQKSTGATDALRIHLIGGNPSPEVTAQEKLPGTSNYFIGSDPRNWRTNVAEYARVRYRAVYPGIDLVYYGNQRQLEYDIAVAPGADPKQVRFAVDGLKPLRLNHRGDLVLSTANGDVLWHKPMVYQEENGGNRLIAGRYRIHSSREFGFEIGDYDRDKPLIIDPVLSYSTYIGGSLDDWFGWMTVDSAGNAYAVGMTQSTNFPRVNPLPTNNTYAGGAHDATIVKLNSTGTARLYSTYLGGNGDDWNRGVAVDSSGNAYVTGYTTSSNFPTVNAYQSVYGGANDAFVAKISPTGSNLLYSSYLGGTGDDFALRVAADNNGNAYIVGYTNSSSNFPIQSALQGAYGGGLYDAFVAKFDTIKSGAASLVYSTLLGGSGDDEAWGVAIDSAGNVYVAGSTGSTNFPTQNPYQASNHGGNDVFVSEINPTETALVFSTYFGGSGDESTRGIVVDSTGIYVAGSTTSTDFPTLNPVQATNHGLSDMTLAKFDPTGSSLIYSTYYGGSSNEYCLALAVDANGRAYLGGMTATTNLSLVSPTQSTYGGSNFDGLVVAFDASGSQVLFSTYFGGNAFDEIQGIAVDTPGNNFYIAGETYSNNLRVTSGVVQPNYGGGGDAYMARFQMNVSAPLVSLSPGSLTFSNRALNTTSPGSNVQLTNTGSASLSITSISASGNFGETDNCAGQTLIPGGSCTITVTFTPSVPGAMSGEITIRDNATATPQLVNLSGTGVYPVLLSPANVSFGTVNVGSTSGAQTVTITNNQTAPVNFSFSASGNYTAAPGSPNGCGSSLAGLGTCTMSVVFTPTATGAINGGLTVQHSASFSPMVVGLSGTGASGAVLTFSPTSLDLGSVAVGGASAPSTVTVTNASSSAVSISSLSGSGNYSVTGSGASPCGGTLAAAAKCTFNVTFTPSVTGSVTGSVSIAHNVVGSPQIYNLTGSGIFPVTLGPASITFPTTAVGASSSSVTVSLTNHLSTAVTISSISASGQFSEVPSGTGPCSNGTIVAAQGTCTFNVTFTPTVGGSIKGVITVIHNAPFSPQEVQLVGLAQ